jgi:hypothetical protein
VLFDGVIQRQPAFVDQLEKHRGRERLGDAANPEVPGRHRRRP